MLRNLDRKLWAFDLTRGKKCWAQLNKDFQAMDVKRRAIRERIKLLSRQRKAGE